MNWNAARQQHLVYSLALSGCDSLKTLAQFDFLAAPGVNRTLIQDLATCAFISRHENILLCGPTGVGKSHLANAIAIEALKRDFRVVSKPTHHLLNDLHAARASGTYPRLLARISRCDLLVLDDFGLQALSAQAVQDLYEIITERYEHGSLIITSNRAFEEWAEVFNNDLLASAALDRLTHHPTPWPSAGTVFANATAKRRHYLNLCLSSFEHPFYSPATARKVVNIRPTMPGKHTPDYGW